MNPIAERAGRLLDDHQKFVLATIVRRQGATPRTAGTRMIIDIGAEIPGEIALSIVAEWVQARARRRRL